MSDTIFDKIVRGEIDAYVVWEDDDHLAFLTPFPNTPGFTVVIPKTNFGDYIFSIDDEAYTKLMVSVKKVARLLEKAFNTKRVALVFEGAGVAYVHAKLIPLHGAKATETGVLFDHTVFNEEYQGYLTTLEGPKMDDARLQEIQAKIKAAAHK